MTAQQPLIMLVEDDARIADMLLNYLSASGFDTCHWLDGKAALRHLAAAAAPSADVKAPRMPDLLLLDLMLPGLDGLALCREVRRFSALPIIMVTARVDEIDRLLGLETGADDYICKPFSPREVVARIRAHLRRYSGQLLAPKSWASATLPPQTMGLMQPSSTGCAPDVSGTHQPVWMVSAAHQQVFWHGKPLPLTPVEFRLLQLLVSKPGHVFGRARLLDHLHEDQRDVSDRAVDSHIKNIRRKMTTADVTGWHLASVYGVGYRFEQDT